MLPLQILMTVQLIWMGLGTSKRCISCGIVKPYVEFHKHKQMSSGRINKCKACVLEYVKKHQSFTSKCYVCGIGFTSYHTGAKTCSQVCKGALISESKESINSGMTMTYGSVHSWIKRVSGKANSCEVCMSLAPGTLYDWSNKSGKYLRDKSDWQQLCRRCHIVYDNTHNGRLDKRKSIYKSRTRDSRGRFV